MQIAKQVFVEMTADEFIDRLRRDNDFRDIGPYRVHGDVLLKDRTIARLRLGAGTFGRFCLGNSIFFTLTLDDSEFQCLDCGSAKVTQLWGKTAKVDRFQMFTGEIELFDAEKLKNKHFHSGEKTSCIKKPVWGKAQFTHIHTEDNLELAQLVQKHQEQLSSNPSDDLV